MPQNKQNKTSQVKSFTNADSMKMTISAINVMVNSKDTKNKTKNITYILKAILWKLDVEYPSTPIYVGAFCYIVF